MIKNSEQTIHNHENHNLSGNYSIRCNNTNTNHKCTRYESKNHHILDV